MYSLILLQCYNNPTCILHVSVPIIFLERSVYTVSEEEGMVDVTVLSNGEHLKPVRFSIVTTNNSAIGKTNMYI